MCGNGESSDKGATPGIGQILKSEAKKPKKGSASSLENGHSAEECTASRARRNVKTSGSTARTANDTRPLQADSAERHDGSRKDINESADDRTKAGPACILGMADRRRKKSDVGAKKKRSRGEEEGTAIQLAEDVSTGKELKKMKPSVSESGGEVKGDAMCGSVESSDKEATPGIGQDGSDKKVEARASVLRMGAGAMGRWWRHCKMPEPPRPP